MCFNQPMSFGFSGLGIIAVFYAYKKTNNVWLSLCVFYFFLMEFLQGWQYFWIDDCQSFMNKFLTFLGLLHICYQPFFSNMLIFASMTKISNPSGYFNSLYQFRLAVVGGTFLLIRSLLGFYFPEKYILDDTSGFGTECFENGIPVGCEEAGPVSTEWIRGREICTVSGKYHLAWSLPMASPSYYLPSTFIHFFLMFAPFFTIKQKNLWILGVFLIVSGPALAAFISPNLMEQASIWCFFSMAQCCFMVVNAVFLDQKGKCYRGEARKKFLAKMGVKED